MSLFDRRTASVLFTILLFGIVLAIIYVARAVIVVFAFSILFAYLINPVVRFLQRHSLFFKNLRGPHIVEAYLAFVLSLGAISHGFLPEIQKNASRFFSEVPAFGERVSSGEIADDLRSSLGWSDMQAFRIKTFLQNHRPTIESSVREIERFASTAFGGLLVIPILAIFFLSDGANLTNQVIQLVSTRESYAEVKSLADDLNVMLQHYIRAKVTLAGLSFAYCSAAMLILRFPHAIALGLLAGVLEFIPVAGWMIAAATISSVGALAHAHWIWMLLLLGFWRILIDYWITPKVIGRELEIHPLLEIFTVMVGGAVGGIVGIYLSVPLVAALRVVYRRLVARANQEGLQENLA